VNMLEDNAVNIHSTPLSVLDANRVVRRLMRMKWKRSKMRCSLILNRLKEGKLLIQKKLRVLHW
jgi:hypothetical protein